ncbi:MAG: hypothetical protein APR53_00480 [Methanoculleus sp. SDB]|nr:MAG: hypothetical protein APR53_00480 [Methanoculleus sp. SDB]
MIFSDECFRCLITRVEFECRLVSHDDVHIESTVRACEALLRTLWQEECPAPETASRIHRLACRLIGSADPYARLKQANNDDALAVLRLVAPSLTTFRDLCLGAVIANTLDYGSRAHHVTDDLAGFFAREFASGFTIDHTPRIERHAARVVYLADNCGEIVFDRPVVNYLKDQGAHVTFVVRGGPILNDATLDDAFRLGFDTLADLLTVNARGGVSELGVNPALFPADLAEALDRATIIISKGMANYESLITIKDLPPVAYLMSVKCDPIARSVGAPTGSKIAMLAE